MDRSRTGDIPKPQRLVGVGRVSVNEVDVVDPDEPLPKLPVARAVWVPQPELKTAAAAWILAGGPHHTSFTQALTTEHLEDFAEMIGLELLVIDASTLLSAFKKELRWNEAHFGPRAER